MPFDRTLLAFIARRFPAAWDLVPRGPQLVALNPQPLPPLALVALNTQPIPPQDLQALNPQPIPPRVLGAIVGTELLHVGWLAERLGTDLPWNDDLERIFCPVFPKIPELPPHIGPVPDPEPGPDWLVDYHLGLASSVAAAPESLARTSLAVFALDRSRVALDAAFEAASSGEPAGLDREDAGGLVQAIGWPRGPRVRSS